MLDSFGASGEDGKVTFSCTRIFPTRLKAWAGQWAWSDMSPKKMEPTLLDNLPISSVARLVSIRRRVRFSKSEVKFLVCTC